VGGPTYNRPGDTKPAPEKAAPTLRCRFDCGSLYNSNQAPGPKTQIG